MLNIHESITHNRQRGVSLVESMISLLVISIGLLGIAALQITSMKQNNSALHHSQAVWVGSNMSERIRSNFGAFASYAGIDTDTSPTQDCLASTCTIQQLVDGDAADWAIEVQNLPAGRGTITADVGNTMLTISVMWDDEGTGATGIACGPDPKVDLSCYTVALVR